MGTGRLAGLRHQPEHRPLVGRRVPSLRREFRGRPRRDHPGHDGCRLRLLEQREGPALDQRRARALPREREDHRIRSAVHLRRHVRQRERLRVQLRIRDRRAHVGPKHVRHGVQVPPRRREQLPGHRFPHGAGRAFLPPVSQRAEARAPTIDVARAREETPGCANVIHFNNAGASLMPRPVLDTVLDHLRLESSIGAYEAAERAAPALERVYDSIAALLGARRDEIAVVENSTRAWDMAFYGLRFKPGDRILTSAAEYVSNYISFLQVARRTGAVIDVVPSEPSGQVSVEALERAIDSRAKLISLTYVPTNGGLVNPARAVGAVARRANVPYILDACQAVGQFPVDVAEIGCDILAATGRKFLRGPRAVGFLYVKREFLENIEPPFLDVHAATWVARDRYEMRRDARRFENY